jgi:hypothetical protein
MYLCSRTLRDETERPAWMDIPLDDPEEFAKHKIPCRRSAPSRCGTILGRNRDAPVISDQITSLVTQPQQIIESNRIDKPF